MQGKRYHVLDSIRGITLLSMVLFHTVWDLVYIFKVDLNWFYADFAFWWQQSICWTFIALSGFCWPLGRRKLFRGLITLGAGFLISLITEIFTPGQRIRFGILTFLGVACLLLIVWDKYLKIISPWIGFVFSCVAFVALYGINDGYIGIKYFWELELPKGLYRMGDVGNFVGVTERSFYSADYFSLIPWIFLYFAGYYAYLLVENSGKLSKLAEMKSFGYFWDALGRKSLVIYMLHQPIIYGLLLLLEKAGTI